MYLWRRLRTVLVLHQDVTQRLLEPLVDVGKPDDFLGVGGGKREKRLVP